MTCAFCKHQPRAAVAALGSAVPTRRREDGVISLRRRSARLVRSNLYRFVNSFFFPSLPKLAVLKLSRNRSPGRKRRGPRGRGWRPRGRTDGGRDGLEISWHAFFWGLVFWIRWDWWEWDFNRKSPGLGISMVKLRVVRGFVYGSKESFLRGLCVMGGGSEGMHGEGFRSG